MQLTLLYTIVSAVLISGWESSRTLESNRSNPVHNPVDAAENVAEWSETDEQEIASIETDSTESEALLKGIEKSTQLPSIQGAAGGDEDTMTVVTQAAITSTHRNAERSIAVQLIEREKSSTRVLMKNAALKTNKVNITESVQSVSVTTVITPSSTMTSIHKLKEAEKVLKEEVAEIEAEPVILSARV